MSKLLYQGHGSFRLTTNDNRVIYIDPFAGVGYDAPASLILVTHQHSDHNQIQLCAQVPNCTIITNKEALAGGKHNSFDVGGIHIESVEAKNLLHSPKKCVGYILTFDGLKIYFSGDTSQTTQMETFAPQHFDYAILPGDGHFNMNPKEAAECAALIGAKHNIICHLSPGKLFNLEKAQKWTAPNKLIIEPTQEIEL